MKISIATVVLGAALALPGISSAQDAAAGAEVYAKKCKNCHGEKGEGNPTMEKMLKVTIKPLNHPDIKAKTDEQISKDIVEGMGKMKPVKDVSPDDVKNVIAHMRATMQ